MSENELPADRDKSDRGGSEKPSTRGLRWPAAGIGRSVLTLVTGTGLAQAILLAISPVLTRLYPPEEFGRFAVFLGYLQLAAVFATGRYAFAIVVERRRRDAVHLLAIAGGVTLIVTLLATAAVTAAGALAGERFLPLLYLLPSVLLMVGLFEALGQWFYRRERFALVSRANVADAVATAVSSIGLGLAGLGAAGLAIGRGVGKMASVGWMGWRLLRDGEARAAMLRAPRLRALLRRHHRFPLYDSWNALCHVATNSLVPILLAGRYGAAVAGLYSLAERLLAAPAGLLGGSISQVYFGRLAQTLGNNLETANATVRRAIGWLLGWGTAPFFLAVYGARYYLAELLGNDWDTLYLYFWALAPAVFARLVFAPISYGLKIIGKQHVSLALNATLLMALLAGFVVAAQGLDLAPLATALVLSITLSALTLINAWWVLRLTGLRAAVPLVPLVAAVVLTMYLLFTFGGLLDA